jgi:hypothetical protein
MYFDSKPMTKNRHAVELAKLGAAKGGRAYALNHSPEERSEAARRAVLARWDRRPATDLWEQ